MKQNRFVSAKNVRAVALALLLFLTPIHIPAILALYGLVSLNNQNSRNQLIHHLSIVAVVLTAATYTLHAMANLYLVAPPGYALESNFLLR